MTERQPQRKKPLANASLFEQAAWYMDDYARLLEDIGATDMPEQDEMIEELHAMDRRLRELDGEWEAKREASTNKSAAEIVADMLRDWKLPGAVWYSPARKRWRVTGENYRAEDGEVCVGVYAPDVSVALLQEDFDATEAA